MTETIKSLLTLSAADIMSKDVVMIPREMSLQGAARMLARAGVTGAPVVDTLGRCVGVISSTDFMRWVKKDHHAHVAEGRNDTMCKAWQIPEGDLELEGCVEHFMTKDPVLVNADVRIGDLARAMIDARIHRVIVVDRVNRRPIGIVTTTDILAAVAREDTLHGPASSFEASGETIHT